jgi:hypothetical protein
MKLPIDYRTASPHMRKLAREEYIMRQHGKCCHCGNDLDDRPAKSARQLTVHRNLFPKGFFDWPVHLHHSHETGMTIGAVHCHCNAVLWEYYGE